MQSRIQETWKDLGLITLGFAVLPAVLLILQVTHHPFGFSQLWVFGEERNWMAMLMEETGSKTAQSFWQLDSRNPLSPWWYVLFRPFFLSVGAAPFILHLTMGWLLGISSYLAFTSLTQHRGRDFAFTQALLSTLFVANWYYDDIIWPFIGALSLSLLCLWSFSQFVNSGREKIYFLYLATIFWFGAFGSYSLQIGAVEGVLAISFASELSKPGYRSLIVKPVVDFAYFMTILFIFLLIWKTTSLTGILDIELRHNVTKIMQSIREGFWHDDNVMFLSWLKALDTNLKLLTFLGSAFCLVSICLAGNHRHSNRMHARDILLCAFCAACIVAPTVYLESGSDVWVPGTRWRMLMQFSTPFLVAFLIIAATLMVPRRIEKWTQALLVGGAAAFCVLLGMAVNNMQIIKSTGEARFIGALKQFVSTIAPTDPASEHTFLVFDRSSTSVPSDWLADQYMKTAMPGLNASWRYISPVTRSDAPPIIFKEDTVEHATLRPDITMPLKDVEVVIWDGKTFDVPTQINASIFGGYLVKWERTGDIQQVAHAKTSCGGFWSAGGNLPATGMSVPEKDNVGPFRWTIATTASIPFSACTGPQDISIRVGPVLSSENLSQLHVELGNRSVDVVASVDGKGTLFKGHLDSFDASEGSAVDLRLIVPKLDKVEGATREFGIGVRSASIQPAEGSSNGQR